MAPWHASMVSAPRDLIHSPRFWPTTMCRRTRCWRHIPPVTSARSGARPSSSWIPARHHLWNLANKAHAGCLSFEMSAAGYPLIVNCGAPGRAFQDWRASGRATAAHSTACFNETSSGRLIEARKFRRKFGARPVQDPANVTVNASQQQGAFKIVASHDGYLARYGIIHTRSLRLDALGERLEGHDRLASPHSVLRFKRDYPFAIHFHLHPDIDVAITGKQAADIIASEEERWRLPGRRRNANHRRKHIPGRRVADRANRCKSSCVASVRVSARLPGRWCVWRMVQRR